MIHSAAKERNIVNGTNSPFNSVSYVTFSIFTVTLPADINVQLKLSKFAVSHCFSIIPI